MSSIKELIASKLRPVANKIREKTGLSETFSVDNMPEELDKIITSEEANEMIKNLIQGGSFETLYIPEGITQIKPYAFYKESLLKKIVFPPSVTNIKENAFTYCYALEEFNFLDNINIGEYAFMACTKLKVIDIPDNCVWAKNVFYNCKLDKMYFPKTISNIDIGGSAKNVYYKGTLSDFLNNTIPSSNTSIFNTTNFEGLYFLNDNNEFEKCDNFIIPLNYTIPLYRFYNMSLPKLTLSYDTHFTSYKPAFEGSGMIDEVIIPENYAASYLVDSAFSGASVRKIKFPNVITKFAQSSASFYKCETVEIGNAVTSIGQKAFYISMGGTIFISNTVTPPSLASNSFSGISKIYVPKGCATAYKSATNWSAHADKIFEPNTVTISIPNELLNNESYIYSIDNGEMQQFTESSLTFENIATFKIKNSGDVTINIGTTDGGTEIGRVGAGAELLYGTVSDTTIYLTIA